MIQLAKIFGDHMILQRDKPLPVWGQASPGTRITVTIQEKSAHAVVREDGCWQAELPPLDSSLAEVMVVTDGTESCTLRDVQVGEVWLAGGQSNMEFHMQFDREFDTEKTICEDDALRFFDVPEISYPDQDTEADYSLYGRWIKAEPEQLARFSAAGYWFARQIRRRYNVPVGIIGCNWGGTPICAWMSEDSVRDCGGQILLDEYAAATADLDLQAYDRWFRSNPGNYHTDLLADFKSNLFMYGKTLPEVQAERAVRQIPYIWAVPPLGPRHERRPAGLYDSMLKPLVPYALRGVLWYQGETDGDSHPELYASLFAALIGDWRTLWREDLPFLFVQLAPFERWMQCEGAPYAAIRAAQQHVADTVPGTGMAVITDAGMRRDIHPKAKRPVGERLARLALCKVYGEEVLCEAPALTTVTLASGLLCLRFQNSGDGLSLSQITPYGEVLPEGRLLGVTISQGSRRIDASTLEARVQGDCVWLSGPSLQAVPTRVEIAQGAWYQVNLYNSAGLPARPAVGNAVPMQLP